MSPFSAGWARCPLSLVKPSSSWAPDWLLSPCEPIRRCQGCRLASHHWLQSAFFSTTHLPEKLFGLSKISSSIYWAIWVRCHSHHGYYDLQQFWQMISGYCMRYCVQRLESETCVHYMPLKCLLKQRQYIHTCSCKYWSQTQWHTRELPLDFLTSTVSQM